MMIALARTKRATSVGFRKVGSGQAIWDSEWAFLSRLESLRVFQDRLGSALFPGFEVRLQQLLDAISQRPTDA
jgi:hypothetical protein